MCKRKNEDLIKYLQLEINEFSSLGTFVDEHTSDILGLYLSKTSVDDFIEKHSSFFSKLAKGYSKVFFKELKKNLTSKISRSAKLEKENSAIPDSDRLDNIEAAMKSAYYMYIRYLQNHLSELSKGRQAAVFFLFENIAILLCLDITEKENSMFHTGAFHIIEKIFKRKLTIYSPMK